MFCSPQLQPPATVIPAALRERLGAVLHGPTRGIRTQRQRACLFALGRVGDFVLSLSALRLLLGEFGPENCTLVIAKPLAVLAGREFPGVRCATLPTEADGLLRQIMPIWWREQGKFAADHYEQLVCLRHQRSLYHELALSWIAATTDFRLMPSTYPAVPAHGLCTELLGHWRLTETVLGRGLTRDEILPRFTSLSATDDGRLLVLPFSLDATRNLPSATLIEALRLWRRNNRAPIVLGGSPTDAPALARLAAAVSATGPGEVSIEMPANLDRMLEQVARAGAVFAADSAPAHVAAALDKPSVVMTSRNFHGFCQPWARSGRQQTFVHGTPPEQVAAALPQLR